MEAFGKILKVAVSTNQCLRFGIIILAHIFSCLILFPSVQVLTFLRSDVHYTFTDEAVPCFAVLSSELEKSQKQLPAKYSQKLCSSYPLAVACGSQREFLRPGSQFIDEHSWMKKSSC